MTFQATVFQAMIASPSDVAKERDIVRAVVTEWTAIHSADKSAVLLPVGWESHATPEMGDRPQGIINRQLLKNCDLLIAVFWTRLGSPTGKAESGTVEEIEEHIAAKKPVMIYFSDAPVRPDSVDSEQYKALVAFKESCRKRGLYESYDSLTEFHDKLARQLAQAMIRLCAGRSARAEPLVAEDFILAPAAPARPALSEPARDLLKSAAQGEGMIMRLKVLGGPMIQIGGHLFNKQGDPRDTAKWEAAIDELERQGFVETSGKREIYRVTHAGYEVADLL